VKTAPFALTLLLAACGDLPQPFLDNPGANAVRLSRPPPAKLVVAPPATALLADRDATAWARAVADALVAEELPALVEPSRKGEWRLVLSAEMQGAQVTPRYTYVDPAGKTHGDVATAPVPASAWAAGDPAVFAKAATEAAPQVLGLVRAVEAASKQSDPDSLYNRPARIFFTGVTGAPGDGNFSLARDMRNKLPDVGDQLARSRESADFLLSGTVRVTDVAGGQQQVEIHWVVRDMQGRVAGDVAQGHDLKRGMLDNYWGEIASVITDEAAGGVHEVITNYSGRRQPGAAAPGPAKMPSKGQSKDVLF
jgi:hypothetical protein